MMFKTANSSSNYELTKNRVKPEFLKYDQQAMIDKFSLKHNSAYLYIDFLSRTYRIDRHTGDIHRSNDGFVTLVEADFNEAMTIYDLLCYSKPNCCLSGIFCPTDALPGVVQGGGPGISLYDSFTRAFDADKDGFRRACEELGGKPYPVGDISFTIPMFDFIPVVIQFWESDEEYPAVLKVMWDRNIQDYMHYETTFYALLHMLERISEIMA